ncbi:Netrin receptor DCC [Fasciola gigantica]|uniref:Netrin receptor DCC n=1 Tax=Fasciola gigantica TaxID=46835 RepID=A0A504YWD3_FASGI|nr:Netrin receptor DCC [Fasciola gigantica]
MESNAVSPNGVVDQTSGEVLRSLDDFTYALASIYSLIQSITPCSTQVIDVSRGAERFARVVARLHMQHSSEVERLAHLLHWAENGNCHVQPVWIVTPDILVRVELPSPPGVHEAQFKEGEELKDRSTTTLWRPAGGSVTLLCAVNLRGHSTESADLNWWSWGSIHVGRKTPETTSVGHNYRLEWTKDGTVVSAQGADGRVSNIGTGHLRIRELQLGDSGVYECRVIRPHMTLGRSSITLSVGHAPKLVGPTEQTVSGHIQAEKNMSCTFVTQPDASFTWTKNAEPVKHSQYFRIGQWSTNGSHDQPDKADQGTNTTSWSVQQRTELSIYGLLPNDEGYFQCFAVNRFGSSQAIYALHVRSPFLTGYQTLGGGVHYSIPLAPSHASVQGLGDTQAYITWTPPEPALKAGLNDSIGYMIRLRTQGTPQGLILNTSKPALLLTDLRPDSHYNVDVFTVNLSNGHHSPDSTSVHFRTKPLVYRPSAVTDLAADAGEFRTLVISWKLPLKPNIPIQPDDEISHYRITMFNLKPNMSTDHLHGAQTKPMHISIPVHQIRHHGDRFTHVVPDLTPDTFYQVSVQAVTVNNVTGYPAVLSSSARVASRPPSKPPTQVRVQAIGARVATVTWQPPPEQYRNGELILYRINITCEDWLRPRQIDVLNSTSKLIRGLIKSTKYELTVSAATRGGNGPDSALVAFTTMNEENAADREASQTESGYFLRGDEDLNPYGATHEKATVTDLKRSTQLNAVENLRAIEDERSILLLWSPPIMWTSRDAKASPALDRYVVKWGQLYPGPQSVTVSANQTRLLIDNLEADTPYMIEVSVYNKNQEAASAMISGRTKPAQFRHRLLIPINLQVTSVDPDGAVVIWDEPKCSAQSIDTISAVECLNKELIKYYQVAYRMIGVKEDKSSLTLDSSAEAEETDTLEAEASLTDTRLDLSTHMLNVSRTVVRLEQLQAGRRYSVMVRAVGKAPLSTGNQEYDLTSEWSMEQVFETPQHKPGDAPHDVSLTALPFTPGDGPVSVQVSWQPPLRPHGRLIGYILYFTADRQLPLHQWSKRRLPADSLNTVLSGLFRGSIYFVQLRARNQHGNGPLSPIRLYRTPDVFGQGGGVIPLGRTYHNATSIPSEFLTFGQTMIDGLNSGSPELGAVQQSVGKPEGARPNNTPMLAVGTLTGLGLLGLAVLLAVIWWRRHRRPFIPVLSYKSSGSHVDSAPNPDGLRSLSKTGSIGSHGAKRGRGAYPNQDIALLMSNGEALNSADPCSPQTLSVQQRVTPTGRHAPNDQLTTSVQLSTGSARPLNVANALHAALLQQQLQNHNRTPSWDRDSDSLQFASVSLQRQADGTPIPGLFDMNPSNNTPTRTGSASTNSGPGSVCTPTRTTGNPAYQTQTVAGFAPEVSMAHSYASSSLGVTSGTVPLILPRSPLNQYQLGASPGYAGGLLNGTAAVVAAVSSSGGLLMPSYYPTTMAYQAIQGSAVPGQPMFLPTTGSPNMFGAQNSSFPVVNAQYLATNSISVNVPRVNAADLMSFTSSDDIRPIMSTSVHKEGEYGLKRPQMAQAAWIFNKEHVFHTNKLNAGERTGFL